MVLFDGPHDLDAAARALVAGGLNVAAAGSHLEVWYDGATGPRLRVKLARGAQVAQATAALAVGSVHAAALTGITARYEIEIDDLAATLDEMNTLIQAQFALQDLTHGHMFTAWNKTLTAPMD